ncbi:MAG: PAS domain-containing protein, partial [Bacteroidales bacterium]|nr:PAS domain-containing protein [Bacteroidales bacterium]
MAYRCKNDEFWTMEFISDGCYEITGYSPQELNESGFIRYGNLIHPDDKVYVWEQTQKAIQNNKQFELEYRIVTRNNRIKWVWERGVSVDQTEGKQIIEGFISDITKRKQAEQGLIESEERHRTISNLIMDFAVAIHLSDEGKIAFKWVYGPFKEITGYSQKEIENHNGFLEILHPEDKNILVVELKKLKEKREPVLVEFKILKKTGEIRWLKGYGNTSQDNLSLLYFAFQDITDQKNAEFQKIKLFEDLLESEAKFIAFMNNLPGYTYIKDDQKKTSICEFVSQNFS